MISSDRLEPPGTYADVFRILGEHDVLTAELATTGQDIARFRNLLVRGYAVVDDQRVRAIVRDRRTDLRRIAAGLAGTAATE